MKICVIVLNWNGREYIADCLESLAKLNIGAHEIEVVVVDNASLDDSVSFIRKKFPKVTLMENSQNLGYAGGNNVGLEYSYSHKFDFSWIVNPDVQVESESLLALLEAAKTYPQGGIFGSKIYFTPGFEFHQERYQKNQLGKVIWYAGGQMDWANLIASHRGVDEVDIGQFDIDLETDFVTGASMFIRNKIIDQIGLMDPAYFLYFEENDYCQRAKKSNWKLMLAPRSLAWHKNAQSTGIGSSLQDYYISRNRLVFGLRYAPLRTKISLIKEAIQLYFSGRPWQRRGVLDYFTGNLSAGSYQP